ncbi:MAG: divalent metal cation transporter [Herminiimonas sp.]|uniref:NRAMP family divalent metal transporter n=1 Tax=Herminiimonas sp. TaxID=1926289 RepID=UPI00271F59C8|nr:divalent metal cation transporter [Herminiimonas sp.]MDO9420306.1 divalent metal cation transporter [Herminiimonas sp.]
MSDEKKSILKKLGPGLITGAADDDPSGIATYSQAGAMFGFGLLWTLFLSYPLMVGVQAISARIGRVTGHGLATNIRKHYPVWLLYIIVSLLLVANTINIAANVAAMGEALKILVGGPALFYSLCFGIASLLLQIFVPYVRYVRILKWLTFALLAYVATVFVIHVPWWEVLKQTVMPPISLEPKYLTTVVAILGTTISPYLFFWQASQEVEDIIAAKDDKPLLQAPLQASDNLQRIKLDTLVGMGLSNAVAFFIILTAAITLYQQGGKEIQSATEAAEALRPVAGDFAFWVFAGGIIGTGLLSVPVLAGSAAYAMAGTFHWKNSLEKEPRAAKKFYAIIAGATLMGCGLCFLPIDPFEALYWSAVVNGVVAVPVIVIMMLMASNSEIMGDFVISGKLKLLGWGCAVMMMLAVLAMFILSET